MFNQKQTQVVIILVIIAFLFGILVMEIANTAMVKFQQELEKNFMVKVKNGVETYLLSPSQVLAKVLELSIINSQEIKAIKEKIE